MAILIISDFRKPQRGILQYPNKILRQVCEPASLQSDETKIIAGKLTEILQEIDSPLKPYLGMSAPQLGFKKRIIAVKESYKKYLVLLNPEIISSGLLLPTVTGCYSLKGLYLRKSHYYLKVKYQSTAGKTKIIKVLGFKSVILDQEIDHINGKMVFD